MLIYSASGSHFCCCCWTVPMWTAQLKYQTIYSHCFDCGVFRLIAVWNSIRSMNLTFRGMIAFNDPNVISSCTISSTISNWTYGSCQFVPLGQRAWIMNKLCRIKNVISIRRMNGFLCERMRSLQRIKHYVLFQSSKCTVKYFLIYFARKFKAFPPSFPITQYSTFMWHIIQCKELAHNSRFSFHFPLIYII